MQLGFQFKAIKLGNKSTILRTECSHFTQLEIKVGDDVGYFVGSVLGNKNVGNVVGAGTEISCVGDEAHIQLFELESIQTYVLS
jgi:hypothetical protein